MAFSDGPRKGGRAAMADRAQTQADELIAQWDSLAKQIPTPRSKKTISGELSIDFARCTRQLATSNPMRIEAWQEKRQGNIALALGALEKFSGVTVNSSDLDTQILMAELATFGGLHEKAKGYIAAVRKSRPGHIRTMALQIENDLDLGGDGKAVMSACAMDREIVAVKEAGNKGKTEEELRVDIAKSRRKVAEGFYDHADFLLSQLKRQGDIEKMKRIRDFLAFLGPKTAANQTDVQLCGNQKGLILAGAYSEKLGDLAFAELQYKKAISVNPNPDHIMKLAGVQRDMVLKFKDEGDHAESRKKTVELSETLNRGRGIAPNLNVWREIERSALRPR